MAANFAYSNIRDFKFILQEWLPTEEIFAYPRFSEYYSKDDVDAILEPVRKMTKELFEPCNEQTEEQPCRFENGKVSTAPLIGPLFHKVQSEGWGTSNIDKSEGAMVLPKILHEMVLEMFTAGNPSFLPYITLTNSCANLIQNNADEDLVEMFVPKMMDGTWAGCMTMTEPSCGSDIGDITARAIPTDDPRIFKIKAQKMFISGGDNDFTENIIHLMTIRVDGAKPGFGGISTMIVPKYWVNADGSLEDNDVHLTGIEHKLGQAGSVTASLSFGDEGKCRGWLVGVNPLENGGKADGLSRIFQMMNEERYDTGMFALACTANAFYNAREYAKERIQGRSLSNPKGDRINIINHEDIKRTLLNGKAHVDVMRAMIYRAFFAFDVRNNDTDPEKLRKADNLIEICTPICKAYNSDECWGLCAEALQVYGGYGFTEDYPVAKIARDSKIYSIWEGTNHMQAMDLITHKWSWDKGRAFPEFMQEIKDFYENNKNTPGFETEFANLEKAIEAYAEIQEIIGGYLARKEKTFVDVYANRILTATAQLYGGSLLLDQALLADKKIKELGTDHYDYHFYLGKVESARYYLNNIVPNVWAVADVLKGQDQSVLRVPVEIFEY